MLKQRVSLKNVSSVAASTTVVIECPVGPRYHYIQLQHGYAGGTNTIAAAAINISEIRVKVNGRVQRTMSGTQLRALNILNGSVYDAVASEVPNTAPGVSFHIHFAEPWRKDARDQDALAWPTNKFDSMQIEVDLSTGTTPTLVVWAVVDQFQPDNVPQICKWIQQSFSASGTSFDISTLDRRDWYTQISLFDPTIANSGYQDLITVRKDGAILHELKALANRGLLQNYGMTPVATRYDIVFDHDDLLGSAVNMNGSGDLNINVATSAANATMTGTLVAIIQRIGPPE